MPSSRRRVLAGTGMVLVSLAGCSRSDTGSDRELSLKLRNYTADSQPVKIEILQESVGDREDAEVLSREFTVPAPADGEPAGTVRRSNVVPAGRYLVRVLPKFGRGDWNHRHYYPSDSGPAEIDIGLYRDEETGAVFTRFL